MFLHSAISPVKLNLSLHIIGINDVGYHLLQGISVFTDYGDIIQIGINTKTNVDTLDITGRYAALLAGNNHNNLITKALITLRDYKDFPFVHIHLDKKIPLEAGYGGGSSNAATTLKTINRMFNLGLCDTDLSCIGRTLGADVPMCLYGKACLVQNIGDDITPLAHTGKIYPCLLLKPNIISASTKEIFQALIHKKNPAMTLKHDVINQAIHYGRNDLWQATLQIYPQLEIYLQALTNTNPIIARMSGSGSGLFALYSDDILMKNAYDILYEQFPNDFLEKTHIHV